MSTTSRERKNDDWRITENANINTAFQIVRMIRGNSNALN